MKDVLQRVARDFNRIIQTASEGQIGSDLQDVESRAKLKMKVALFSSICG